MFGKNGSGIRETCPPLEGSRPEALRLPLLSQALEKMTREFSNHWKLFRPRFSNHWKTVRPSTPRRVLGHPRPPSPRARGKIPRPSRYHAAETSGGCARPAPTQGPRESGCVLHLPEHRLVPPSCPPPAWRRRNTEHLLPVRGPAFAKPAARMARFAPRYGVLNKDEEEKDNYTGTGREKAVSVEA